MLLPSLVQDHSLAVHSNRISLVRKFIIILNNIKDIVAIFSELGIDFRASRTQINHLHNPSPMSIVTTLPRNCTYWALSSPTYTTPFCSRWYPNEYKICISSLLPKYCPYFQAYSTLRLVKSTSALKTSCSHKTNTPKISGISQRTFNWAHTKFTSPAVLEIIPLWSVYYDYFHFTVFCTSYSYLPVLWQEA